MGSDDDTRDEAMMEARAQAAPGGPLAFVNVFLLFLAAGNYEAAWRLLDVTLQKRFDSPERLAGIWWLAGTEWQASGRARPLNGDTEEVLLYQTDEASPSGEKGRAYQITLCHREGRWKIVGLGSP